MFRVASGLRVTACLRHSHPHPTVGVFITTTPLIYRYQHQHQHHRFRFRCPHCTNSNPFPSAINLSWSEIIYPSPRPVGRRNRNTSRPSQHPSAPVSNSLCVLAVQLLLETKCMQEQTSSRGRYKAADNDRSTTKAMPLSAAQVQEHPEFPHVNWNLTPTKKGKIAAARDRGGPINIAFEIHGTGPSHVVVSQSLWSHFAFTRISYEASLPRFFYYVRRIFVELGRLSIKKKYTSTTD